MANFFYGSSNVYRSFTRAVSSGCFTGRDLQLDQCTKKAVLDAHLATLTSGNLIVTSVLENFITEVCCGIPDDEIQLFAHQQITAHVDTLLSLVNRLPAVNVIICPPIFRSDPSWFGSYLPDLQGFLAAEVARAGSSRMGVSAPFIVVPSILESDGVHLTPAGADRFLSHIDGQLQLMLVDAVDLPDEAVGGDRLSQILDVVSRNTTQLDSISALGATVSTLRRTTSEFEAFARRRFKDDDFIFARLKEEADADLNRSREDRVVITGLSQPPPGTFSHAEKKKHYTEVVTRLITLTCVSADPLPKVTDVYINLRKDRGLPLVEVRFDTVSGAQLFRREGVKLAKAEQPEFTALFFSNSVTQSTRVRIEVMKALSKKLTTASESSYVQGFISRPVLQYHAKEGVRSTADGVGRSYTYVDAIAKFGSLIGSGDLSTAYLRAGNTFVGAMSQYFIVMNEACVAGGSRSGVNRAPLGRRGGRFSRRRVHPQMLSRVPIPPAAAPTDRGLKRGGDPNEGPSKKNEVGLDMDTE